MNRPEKTTDAMVVVQWQSDESGHVHVAGIVPNGGTLGLEDWFGEACRATGVYDKRKVFGLFHQIKAGGDICVDALVFVYRDGGIIQRLSRYLSNLQTRKSLSELCCGIIEGIMDKDMSGLRFPQQ